MRSAVATDFGLRFGLRFGLAFGLAFGLKFEAAAVGAKASELVTSLSESNLKSLSAAGSPPARMRAKTQGPVHQQSALSN